MTETEIVKRFRRSARPLVEIGIIADELNTTAPEIMRVLAENGVNFPINKTEEKTQMDKLLREHITAMIGEKHNNADIAAVTGASVKTVAQVRRFIGESAVAKSAPRQVASKLNAASSEADPLMKLVNEAVSMIGGGRIFYIEAHLIPTGTHWQVKVTGHKDGTEYDVIVGRPIEKAASDAGTSESGASESGEKDNTVDSISQICDIVNN